MDQEQRFGLAISLKNLKQNKSFIFILLGIITGLYLGYPLSTFKASSKLLKEEYEFLSSLYTSPLNVSSPADVALPSKGMIVKWGFDSAIPPACKEENVFDLGDGVFISVCNYKGRIMIDIRKFTGNYKICITPTIKGIGLNVNQWNIIKKYTSIIDQALHDLS